MCERVRSRQIRLACDNLARGRSEVAAVTVVRVDRRGEPQLDFQAKEAVGEGESARATRRGIGPPF